MNILCPQCKALFSPAYVPPDKRVHCPACGVWFSTINESDASPGVTGLVIDVQGETSSNSASPDEGGAKTETEETSRSTSVAMDAIAPGNGERMRSQRIYVHRRMMVLDHSEPGCCGCGCLLLLLMMLVWLAGCASIASTVFL